MAIDRTKNMEFWNQLKETDPDHVKPFTSPSGKTLHAIKPIYLVQKATSFFGPMGVAWGVVELENKLTNAVWMSKVQVWVEAKLLTPGADGVAKIEQWGGTSLTLENGQPDPDVAKKAFTDGMTKCLSYLGFGADIHMGLFDKPDYVNRLKSEKSQAEDARRQNAVTPSRVAPKSSAVPKPAATTQFPPQISGVKYAEFVGGDGQLYLRTVGQVASDKAELLRRAGFAFQRQHGYWSRQKQAA